MSRLAVVTWQGHGVTSYYLAAVYPDGTWDLVTSYPTRRAAEIDRRALIN